MAFESFHPSVWCIDVVANIIVVLVGLNLPHVDNKFDDNSVENNKFDDNGVENDKFSNSEVSWRKTVARLDRTKG
ncbi:unnamed protein product [Cochlearia groenlandica]